MRAARRRREWGFGGPQPALGGLASGIPSFVLVLVIAKSAFESGSSDANVALVAGLIAAALCMAAGTQSEEQEQGCATFAGTWIAGGAAFGIATAIGATRRDSVVAMMATAGAISLALAVYFTVRNHRRKRTEGR